MSTRKCLSVTFDQAFNFDKHIYSPEQSCGFLTKKLKSPLVPNVDLEISIYAFVFWIAYKRSKMQLRKFTKSSNWSRVTLIFSSLHRTGSPWTSDFSLRFWWSLSKLSTVKWLLTLANSCIHVYHAGHWDLLIKLVCGSSFKTEN